MLTAGFDKALHVIAIAELLNRNNHEIKAIYVVTPFNWKRLRVLIRQRGVSGVKNAIARLLNKAGPGLKKDPLKEFLDINEIKDKSLKSWANKHNVHYKVTQSLNNARLCEDLKKLDTDYVIYGGGGILKESFIDAANGKIINSHSGSLPEIRGMNACEWSLLLGLDLEVTVHFIDRGIDTGEIISKVSVDKSIGDDIETLRSKCIVSGVQEVLNLVKTGDDIISSSSSNPIVSRQCFVLAPVLKELLEYQLLNNK